MCLMCVCLCVREREGERSRARVCMAGVGGSAVTAVFQNKLQNAIVRTHNLEYHCLMSLTQWNSVQNTSRVERLPLL